MGLRDPDRLAPQPFRHRDVIDAVALFRIAGSVDIVEGEAHFEIHVQPALRLADEAEIGIVHDHMQVRQLVLGTNGQFLDHELEIIVARQRHDRPLRIGRTHAERCRQRPAEAVPPGRN